MKELEEKSCRNLHDLPEDYSSVAEVHRLKRIPHFTSPQKFLSRIPACWLRMMMSITVELLTSNLRLSIDATGSKQVSGSHHYLKRIGKKIRRRDFLKGIHFLEIETGLFYDARSINGRRNTGGEGTA